jgi:nucleotide-binding universal stress UspA family protein
MRRKRGLADGIPRPFSSENDRMYKHVLIAVDGSELSDKALAQGLELAKALSAKVTLVHVTAPWASIAVGEVAVMFPPEEYEANVKTAAARLVERLGK